MSQKTQIPLPILKYNESGELVETYARLIDAISACKIGYYKLEQVLITGELYKGFIYKASSPLNDEIVLKGLSRNKREATWEPPLYGKQRWEGDDGYFDIDGWAKTVL